MILERDEAWFAVRLPMLEQRIDQRLAQLSHHLGKAEWMDGEFSPGDLLMISVLLRIRASGLLEHYPDLAA
jgi:glutathione S-transferase